MKQKNKWIDLLLDVLVITVGSVIYAVSVDVFTAPNHIAPGGITGLSTVLNYLFHTPIGLVAFLINVPIIIWGVMEIGYKLVVKTLFCIALSSAMIDILAPVLPIYEGNLILAALIAGVLEGLGLSLTFIRGATTGGTDMIALSKRLTAR